MSEPKLISPLLDNYVMGEPVSNHDGVQCCPAMQKESDQKYIVKIISVPASQRNLDALLLAGAFRSQESALTYFRELAEGITDEAATLQRLSKLEGFLSYNGWQIEAKEKGTGYDIYLVSDYRPSLERYFRKYPMTHLAAVNLGLDLCAALAVCRRCGYLYVDLKPGNVFVCDDHEYRIGDLGFVSLKSLQYASLPDRYRSAYTAPEITDAYSALNPTLDIYAAGLILYQAYNNGVLPFEGQAPAEALPAPMYADYEMAEIILKACAPDPNDRWQNPLEMGKALVSYMQKNSVNDTPIVPPSIATEPVPPAEEEEAPVSDEPEEAAAEIQAEGSAEFQADDTPEPPVEDAADGEDSEVEYEELTLEEFLRMHPDDLTTAVGSDSMDGVLSDETVPSEESAAMLEDTILTEEVSSMLALADELIAHETPEPVVAPEAIEVVLPTESAPDETEEEAPTAADEMPEAEEVPAVLPEENPVIQEENAPRNRPPAKKRSTRAYKAVIAILLVVLLLLMGGIGGYAFYNFYYLQTVESMTLSGQNEQVTVYLDTSIDNSLLTVACQDAYGNIQRQPVVNGQSAFANLSAGTSYKLWVEIEGFHQLQGQTEATYTTAEETSILNFNVVTGTESGSAIVSFAVQGPDTSWQIVYSAEGEPEKSVSCTDHTAAIQGLTLNTTYTFRLVPATPLYIVGDNTVEYTAVGSIFAEDLQISSFMDNKLTAVWTAPAGQTVANWTVRCYNNAGFDHTITVTEPVAVFDIPDTVTAYNVEVTAEGMTRGTTASISENTVTVHDIQIEPQDANTLSVTWEFGGGTPDGWRVLYYIDSSAEPLVVTSESHSAILPLVPGSHYEIAIVQASGNTVLGGTASYDTAQAAELTDFYWLNSGSFDFRTCEYSEALAVDDNSVTFVDTYAPGSKASLLMHTQSMYQQSFDQVENLYVIRDANGAVVSITNPTRVWADMLEGGFGLINLPTLPAAAGEYTVDIYFNGAFVSTVSITLQ